MILSLCKKFKEKNLLLILNNLEKYYFQAKKVQNFELWYILFKKNVLIIDIGGEKQNFVEKQQTKNNFQNIFCYCCLNSDQY
jgi:hypothetical protein